MTEAATPAMLIAAEIVREHPMLADEPDVLKAILRGLRKAILEEREACQAEADRFAGGDSVNRPEFSDLEIAVKFAVKATAATVSGAIGDRGRP